MSEKPQQRNVDFVEGNFHHLEFATDVFYCYFGLDLFRILAPLTLILLLRMITGLKQCDFSANQDIRSRISLYVYKHSLDVRYNYVTNVRYD